LFCILTAIVHTKQPQHPPKISSMTFQTKVIKINRC
jgi:hypothetical protein